VIPRTPSSEYAGPNPETESVALGQPPEFELPDLPRDLTALNDPRLMTLFSEFVAWQNYAATKLGEYEIEETRAEAAQRYAEDLVMMGASKGEIQRTRHTLSQDKQVEDARNRAIQAYALRKTTAVVFANCERVVNLISRELSRRIATSPTERRNQRWNP
jgi:hypothetical protein